jgi:hypothetical protein
VVKINDIFDSINKLIISPFPTDTVYIQRCPKDFDKPSFLLEYIKTSKRDINRSTIEKTAYFTITRFVEKDEYYRSNPLLLAEQQETIVDLFNIGYITVGDRAIKVKSSAGGIDTDRAYIDLQFEYFDNRTDAVDATPLMTSVTTNLQEG